MYKLIAIDIDDTLINDDKEVTPATQTALEQAVAAGVVVTLATGRAYASAQAIARQTGLNVPIITYQGALVKNLLDEEVLYERYVPQDAVRKLFQYCVEHNLHLQTYIDDKLYAREENQKLIDYSTLNGTQYYIEPDWEAKLVPQKHQKCSLSTIPTSSMSCPRSCAACSAIRFISRSPSRISWRLCIMKAPRVWPWNSWLHTLAASCPRRWLSAIPGMIMRCLKLRVSV